MESTKAEQYGVARKGELLGVLYGTEEEARQQHAHVTQTLGGLGVDTSDVDLVAVTVTTSYGKPRVITEPAPTEEDPTTDGDAGDPDAA